MSHSQQRKSAVRNVRFSIGRISKCQPVPRLSHTRCVAWLVAAKGDLEDCSAYGTRRDARRRQSSGLTERSHFRQERPGGTRVMRDVPNLFGDVGLLDEKVVRFVREPLAGPRQINDRARRRLSLPQCLEARFVRRQATSGGVDLWWRFVNGGSSPPTYSGANLAKREVTVVSFN